MGRTSRWLAVVVLACAAACGAADNRVDPGDLALRDVLGMAPEVALGWDGAQRAAARAVLADGLGPDAATTAPALGLAGGRNRDERIARTLAAIDRARAADGDDAFGLVRVAVDGTTVRAAALPGPRAAGWAAGAAAATIEPVELWLAPAWDEVPGWAPLPDRGFELLAALAHDAGHGTGPVLVAPSPRLAVISAYVDAAEGPPVLLVNPVLLAAQEPADDEAGAGAAGAAAVSVVRGGGPAGAGGGGARAPGGGLGGDAPAGSISIAGTGGNPYSFYGSVAECAWAQRTRCEACLPSNTCEPVTDSPDGNIECTTLAADLGRGYFLLCANLSLSISSVNACVEDEAPGCAFVVDAASRIAQLDANARFVDDMVCSLGLDSCLADIYGAPDQPFPGPGGGPPPPDPPRNLSIDCGDGCSNNNANCEAGCGDCSSGGPSCNNSLSCDSGCSSSNEQSGCGGNCEACTASDDSGGSTGGGCGGCDSDGSDSGDNCSSDSSNGNGSCDSCSSDNNNESGGSCGSCSSDSSSGDSGCSGGGCGSGDSGGGCGGGSGGGGCGGSSGGSGCSGGGGGGGNSCNVARRGPPPGLALAIAGLWGVLPIPVAGWFLRRARRRRARGEPGPDADGGAPRPDAGGGDGGAS